MIEKCELCGRPIKEGEKWELWSGVKVHQLCYRIYELRTKDRLTRKEYLESLPRDVLAGLMKSDLGKFIKRVLGE